MNIATEYSFGQAGADLIDDTEVQNGHWVSLHFLADTVIQRMTVDNMAANGAAIPSNEDINLSFLAGTVIYGTFRSLTLASGRVMAYRRPRS
jgi:hypothetical protein